MSEFMPGFNIADLPGLEIVTESEGPISLLPRGELPDFIVTTNGTTAAFEAADGAEFFGSAAQDIVDAGSFDDVLYGAGGDDFLYGDDGNDFVFGGTGDDVLRGGADDDFMMGNGGDDLIVGGAGDDTLSGGIGSDTMIGGTGSDVFRLDRRNGLDFIKDFNPDEDVIALNQRLLPGLRRLTVQTVDTLTSKVKASIVYEASTGVLYYNPRQGTEVPLYQLQVGLDLSAENITLF